MLNLTTTQAKNDFLAAQQQLKIAKDNLKFATMTKAEKRVQIAKDVLSQLQLKKINPNLGIYVGSSNGTSCEACALGALFVCASVRVGNSFDKVLDDIDGDFYDPEYLREQLSPFFSDDQLGKIECAFEGWDDGDSEYGSAATYHFNYGISDDRERMERVMKNIIRNGGTFVPSDRG